MTPQDILLFIAIVTFSITIGTLIWKMSRLNSKCENNEIATSRAHQRIDKLDDKQEHKIDALAVQVKEIEKVQIRMEEKINIIIKMEKQKTN